MFTFKINKPTGRYKAFSNTYVDIKLNKNIVGSILVTEYCKISFMVFEPNEKCGWKWIILNYKPNTIEDAKLFLNKNFKAILKKHRIYTQENYAK